VSGGIVIDQVSIRYPDSSGNEVVACENVSLDIAQGEFVVLVGRSGCGKTSLLNAIDGLVSISSGQISVAGKGVDEPSVERAMVFQSPRLMPWRRIIDNVAFGLEATVGRVAARERSRELLALVGLAGFERHWPHQLSGGMQQRVNLARALAVDPKVLLLDEPFSALDAFTREQMQIELLQVWRKQKEQGGIPLTMIFVTHDIGEALFLADRIVVMSPRPGRVKEIVNVELPRPRDVHVRETDAFQDLARHMRTLLEGDD
jgi:NitT/TauT family transport system ATP-binding protein